MVSRQDIDELYAEVSDNYQTVTSIILRLTEIHNDIALMEITGDAPTELKKFRTMIVDPSIERLQEVARFESRKLTGKQIEWDMSKNG